VLSFPATAHYLPLSMEDFENLAQANAELALVYGGCGMLMQRVLDRVLCALQAPDGKQLAMSRAETIMGKNPYGINPKQACLATSRQDLQRRLVMSFIQTEWKEVLTSANAGEGEPFPQFIQERIGHNAGFFLAFLECLIDKVLAHYPEVCKVATSVYARYRSW